MAVDGFGAALLRVRPQPNGTSTFRSVSRQAIRRGMAVLVGAFLAGCGPNGPGSDDSDVAARGLPTEVASSPAVIPTPTSPVAGVVVPDVTGMSARSASHALFDAGLVATPVDGPDTDDVALVGTVSRQSPEAGRMARDGDPVELEIWWFPEGHVITADEQAQMVAATLEDDAAQFPFDETNVRSVDVLRFRVDDRTFEVRVTTRFEEQELQRRAAWNIARTFAEIYWEADFWGGEFWLDGRVPSFELTVDGHRFRCGAEIMSDVAERAVFRGEWEAACEVSGAAV